MNSSKSFDELTKNEKKVVAKVALDLNVSACEIADILGIERTTVYRYSEQPTPEELQQFATEIKTILEVKRQCVIAKTLKQLEDAISKSQRVKDLAYTYDILTKNRDKDESTIIPEGQVGKVLVIPGELMEKYGVKPAVY